MGWSGSTRGGVVAFLACVFASAILASGCLLGSSPQPLAGSPDPDTSIDVNGAIGGIHTSDTRRQVEKRLGAGKTISTSTRQRKVGGDYTITRGLYPASQLVVWYAGSSMRPPLVVVILTSSPRYHTADGLRVGSTLAQARHEPSIRCSAQLSDFRCEGGLGYEKPVTGFEVKDGRVVRVFVAAVAD